MTNKILINATSPSETRIALISDGDLIDFDLQSGEHFRTKSNIYKGVVTRIEPSLEAIFVNYGETKNGFLPAKEINSDYLSKPYRRDKDLKGLIKIGQEMIVQVVKEARKDKGAALTTYVTISSRSIVLNRGYGRKVNISRNISGGDRIKINQIIGDIRVPDGFTVIVRTVAKDLSADELKWDMDYLKRLWEEVQKIAAENPPPTLILRESDVITRTIRDRLNNEIDEVVVDSPESYSRVKNLVQQTSPNLVNKVSEYKSDIPLFTHYAIEKAVQSAFRHIVNLPTGGKLVIDRTEAMFIIDVNSSQSNQGASVEDTALNNNLEAVTEIARQMRLRDIGGLMVIDFIDMMKRGNKIAVEEAFNEEVKRDKAYVRMSNISRFGMMEVSRQRLKSSLDEFYLEKCHTCNGAGTILTISALTGNIFRSVNEIIQNSLVKEIECLIPKEVNDTLQDIYADELSKLEVKYPGKIKFTMKEDMHFPHYSISFTNVNGVTSKLNEYGDALNSSSNDRYGEKKVNRKPLINASEVLNQVPPNKISLWSKIFGIFKKLWPSDKPKSSKKHRPRRRGGYNSTRKFKSQSNSKNNQNTRGQSNYRGKSQQRPPRRGRRHNFS